MLFTPSSGRCPRGPSPQDPLLFPLPPPLSIKALCSSLGLALGQVLPRVSLALPGAGRAGISAPQGRRWLSIRARGATRCTVACGARLLSALAHGEDASGVVAGAVQQAVEPALEGWWDALPLAQREDAGGVVAHAVQEVIDAAGAGLLPAALGQTLPGSGQGAEQEQEQEAGSSLELPEQRAALVQGSRQCRSGEAAQPQGPAVPAGVSAPVCPGLCSAACLPPLPQGPSPTPRLHPEHHPSAPWGTASTAPPKGAGSAAPRAPPAPATTAHTHTLTSSQAQVPSPPRLPCSGTWQPRQTPSPRHRVPWDKQPEHPRSMPEAPCAQVPPEEAKRG